MSDDTHSNHSDTLMDHHLKQKDDDDDDDDDDIYNNSDEVEDNASDDTSEVESDIESDSEIYARIKSKNDEVHKLIEDNNDFIDFVKIYVKNKEFIDYLIQIENSKNVSINIDDTEELHKLSSILSKFYPDISIDDCVECVRTCNYNLVHSIRVLTHANTH
jgi:hypothetical protein